jgi:hypothetical protein
MSSVQSAAVARSWQDPEVAAKRTAHHGLMVDGQIYSSTHQAFKALGLGPRSQHRKWRLAFKNLVDRQSGILVKGYPMPDGSYRDVMLTEPGAGSATIDQVIEFAEINDGTAYLPSSFTRRIDIQNKEEKPFQAIDPAQITEAEAEYYQARKLDPNEPWFVYLIVEEGRLARQFKVGMALNIQNRMASLTQGLPWSVEAALTRPRPRYLAYRLEQQVLNALKERSNCHLDGEFFRIDQRWIDFAANMINQANVDYSPEQ